MIEFVDLSAFGWFISGLFTGLAGGFALGKLFAKPDVTDTVDVHCEVPLQQTGKHIKLHQNLVNGKPKSVTCWYLKDVRKYHCVLTGKKCRYVA